MNIENIVLNGRNVGMVLNGMVYVSKRNTERHLFRGGKSSVSAAINGKTAAWGISHDVMSLILDAGVKVLAIDSDKGVYWTSVSRMMTNGFFLEMSGHGLQRFLKLEHWSVAGSVHDVVNATGTVLRRAA